MFKPLAKYKDKTFIHNIIFKLNQVCEKIFIVTGFNSEKLKGEIAKTYSNEKEILGKLHFVYNENYEQGMFTSLQKGILAAKNCDWVLYHFVDQPGLPEIFYYDFILQIDNQHNWIQPSYKNKNGHPILISQLLFEAIINSPADSSLREINKNPIVKRKFWECNYEEIFLDIDTDEDLENI